MRILHVRTEEGRPPSALLRLFVEEALPVFERTMTRTRCLNATAVGLAVLGHFGIACQPMSVVTIAMNPLFAEKFRTLGRWPSRAEVDAWIAEGAWSVGIDPGMFPDDGEGGWNGHLVLTAQDRLVDLASGGLDRPARGIPMPDVLTVPIEPRFLKGKRQVVAPMSEVDDGARVVYRNRVGDRSWMDMPGVHPSIQNIEVAGEIVKRMKVRRRDRS